MSPTALPRILPRLLPRLVLVAALGAAVATPTDVSARVGDPQPGGSGIGDPYWPLDGNGGIDVASYKVKARYHFAKGRLAGRTTLRLTATSDLSSFSLDFLLPVRRVEVDGVRASFDVSHRGHELRITPVTPLAAGTAHRVVVSYAGRPGRERYAGERNWLADKHEVVAMNEPHMAPWWFPANDHPLDKALVDVSITVPQGKEVVSNGRAVAKRTRSGRTTWRWRADEPMAPYLAFFAAGDFEIQRGSHAGLPWVTAVSKRLPLGQQRRAIRLVRRSAPMVKELEQDLGAYPFSTTGGLVTSLDPGFALENQTRPTYSAWFDASTVVHELAHQWFGDHVAVSRWRDIWLNEGFATFMEWRWAERQGRGSAARALRSSYDLSPDGSDFWELTIGDPGPERLFDWAVYERGAMTLQALRNRVGDETFWRILQTWLERKGGGNGTSEEFEALAAELSGQDLSAFFTAWLRTPAKPANTAANGLG